MAQKLSRKRIKLLIKILKITKKDLPRTYARGLCAQILDTTDELKRKAFWKYPQELLNIEDSRRYLSKWIEKLLGSKFSWYEDWVHENYPHLLPKNIFNTWDLPEKIERKAQKGRIAWLNWMINELESELK